jgi:hypothetical protein
MISAYAVKYEPVTIKPPAVARLPLLTAASVDPVPPLPMSNVNAPDVFTTP